MSILALRRTYSALIILCVVLAGLLAYGQQAVAGSGPEPPGAWLANLNATALLGMGLLSSLTVLGFVLKTLAGRLLQVIEQSCAVMQAVRDELSSCRAWREKQ